MSSKVGTHNPDNLSGSGAVQEREAAPSTMLQDQPQVGRWLGTIGLALALLGIDWICWLYLDRSLSRLIIRFVTGSTVINLWASVFGTPFFVLGIGLMMLHASSEKDLEIRRAYGLLGALWLLVGVILAALQCVSLAAPTSFKWAASLFVPGFGCLVLGLVFLLAFVRNETDTDWRQLTVLALGGLGAAAAAIGFLVSNITASFLVPNGVLLILFGLASLWAFISLHGDRDDQGEWVARATAVGGGLFFLIALVRSYLYPLFTSNPTAWAYIVPTGVVLMALGVLYVALYALLRVEGQFLAITRRELASFFRSPIAYVALFASAFMAWWSFVKFLGLLFDSRVGGILEEPIILPWLLDWPPLIALIGLVPVLTMNTLSDERRTGTLEMLLTSPVDEIMVVLGKFVATLIFFLLAWLPWLLFPMALSLMAGSTIDFRPILSFLIALTCMGAGFLAMGIFFSSISRHWYVAAIATSGGMLAMLVMFFLYRQLEQSAANSIYVPVLKHMSFVILWWNSLEGKLQPSLLLFYISAAVFWLFLTVKVLEARKWT